MPTCGQGHVRTTAWQGRRPRLGIWPIARADQPTADRLPFGSLKRSRSDAWILRLQAINRDPPAGYRHVFRVWPTQHTGGLPAPPAPRPAASGTPPAPWLTEWPRTRHGNPDRLGWRTTRQVNVSAHGGRRSRKRIAKRNDARRSAPVVARGIVIRHLRHTGPSGDAAWSARGASTWHDDSAVPGIIEVNEQVTFPPFPCDRYPSTGHPLPDLSSHRRVPARHPQ